MTNRPNLLNPRPTAKLLSVVIPIYNEEEVISHLRRKLSELGSSLPSELEFIFVNDGSSDKTADVLLDWAREDARVKIINLARNFGHQIASTAGLDYAQGDAIVLMDSDLQDPPDIIGEMLAKYREGYDVVYAQRLEREGESWFKQYTAWAFYRLMRALVHKDLPADVGDFRLMSSRFVRALRQMRETHRFLRGMVTWVGYPQTAVTFRRPARIAGRTKFSLRKMVAFAATAILSFSSIPLRLSVIFGLLIAGLSAAWGLYSIFHALFLKDTVPGWTTLVILQAMLGGSILISIGVLGEYVARTYEQSKQRPLYFVASAINLPQANNEPE
jgi:polyisoprenyl-phosphate glycosyltransferase